MNSFVGDERFLGTARGRVVHLPDVGLYVIAVQDKFGKHSTFTGRRMPSDQIVTEALLVHINMSSAGRN